MNFDSIPTLDIITELSKRRGVICNCVVSEEIPIATIFIVGQEDQAGIMELCAKRIVELEQEAAE